MKNRKRSLKKSKRKSIQKSKQKKSKRKRSYSPLSEIIIGSLIYSGLTGSLIALMHYDRKNSKEEYEKQKKEQKEFEDKKLKHEVQKFLERNKDGKSTTTVVTPTNQPMTPTNKSVTPTNQPIRGRSRTLDASELVKFKKSQRGKDIENFLQTNPFPSFNK